MLSPVTVITFEEREANVATFVPVPTPTAIRERKSGRLKVVELSPTPKVVLVLLYGEAKIDGLLLTRKAVYRVLTDNRDTKSLSLAGYIEYYNQDKELVSIIPRKPFELIADTNHFVLNKDGSYIGYIS